MHDNKITQLLSRGDAAGVGKFSHWVSTGRWWWSDDTFRLHGFEPGDVVPTTELMLAHCDPGDHDHVSSALVRRDASAFPFAHVYRIIDAHGTSRVVSMTGAVHQEADGAVIAGYLADVSEPVQTLASAEADASIRAAAQSRRDIEQAKAVVLITLGLTDDEEAFATLRRASNDANVPVRRLAEQLMERVHAGWVPTAAELAELLTHPLDTHPLDTHPLDDEIQLPA